MRNPPTPPQFHPIVVKRSTRLEEAVDAQILFVGESERGNAARIAKRLGSAPVLTVSDLDRFAEEGGMVQLVMDQNRVRFAINVAAAERAGLEPSSQLLKLAQIVNGSILSVSDFSWRPLKTFRFVIS